MLATGYEVNHVEKWQAENKQRNEIIEYITVFVCVCHRSLLVIITIYYIVWHEIDTFM